MSKSKRKLKRSPTPAQPGLKNEISPEQTAADDSSQADVESSSQAAETVQSTESTDAPAPVIDRYNEPSLIAKLAGAKKVVYRPGSIDPDVPHEFKRAAWRHFIRYPFAFALVMLNVASVMTFIGHLSVPEHFNLLMELLQFAVVGFIDVFMFIPMVFEVNRIRTDATGIKIGTLLWRVRLTWDQIVQFSQPKYLKFSFLRTKKSFYIIHKYNLKPSYFELAEIISAKMPTPIEDSEA